MAEPTVQEAGKVVTVAVTVSLGIRLDGGDDWEHNRLAGKIGLKLAY